MRDSVKNSRKGIKEKYPSKGKSPTGKKFLTVPIHQRHSADYGKKIVKGGK